GGLGLAYLARATSPGTSDAGAASGVALPRDYFRLLRATPDQPARPTAARSKRGMPSRATSRGRNRLAQGKRLQPPALNEALQNSALREKPVVALFIDLDQCTDKTEGLWKMLEERESPLPQWGACFGSRTENEGDMAEEGAAAL